MTFICVETMGNSLYYHDVLVKNTTSEINEVQSQDNLLYLLLT